MEDITLFPVHHEDVPQIWPLLADLMKTLRERKEATLFNLEWTNEEIVRDLLDREKQLWLGTLDGQIEGFAITQVYYAGWKKICNIWVTVADTSCDLEWDRLIPVIEDWAKNREGCHAVTLSGRVGWKRVLRGSGYETLSTTFIKAL